MSARPRRASGFTLVEILIVVVILGILAAIVIPQFTNASDSAKGSSLTSQLQTIRSQLELAQIQHGSTYPDLSTDWSSLTTKTAGVAAYTASTATTAFGPYLQQAPVNAFENSSTTGAAAAAGVGWVYASSNGAIKAVMASAKASNLYNPVPTNDIATY